MKLPWFLKQRTTVALIVGLGGMYTMLPTASAQGWVQGPVAPPQATTSWWNSLADSADGSRWAGALGALQWYSSYGYGYGYGYYGYGYYLPVPTAIYLSTNGASALIAAHSPLDVWQLVAMSADGSKIFAAAAQGYSGFYAAGSGQLCGSINSGTNWTTWTLGGPRGNSWSSLAVSADGTRVMAAAYYQYGGDGSIYATTNGGTSWLRTRAPANDWHSIACSADGSKWMAVSGPGYFGTNGLILGGIYSSTNSGATWNRTTAPGKNWSSIACSADGSKLIAACEPYYDSNNNLLAGAGVFVSADAGATWHQTSAPTNYSISVSCSADASTLTAVQGSYGCIYMSRDGGLTWTTGSPTAPWMTFAMSADGHKAAAATVYGQLFTWPYVGPWQVANSAISQISCVACSGDGAKIFVGETFDDSIYASTNSGRSWSRTTAPGSQWSCLASSVKGTRLFAGGNSTSTLSYSGNGGASWTQLTGPLGAWSALAASADGTVGLAVSSENSSGNSGSGQVYVSHNSGASWQLASLPLNAWSGAVCSADGTKLFVSSGYTAAGAPYGGAIYASTNSGSTWRQIAWNDDWECLSSASDGMHLIAGTRWYGQGLIYTSGDGGNTWARSGAPLDAWSSLACSGDGASLAAIAYGVIYLSTNSGASWHRSDTPAGSWSRVTCSADSDTFIAVGYGPIIILNGSQAAGAAAVCPPLCIGRTGGNLLLGWVVPGSGVVLQESAGAGSNLWLDITNQPVLNYSNLHQEVILCPSAPGRFYRLRPL